MPTLQNARAKICNTVAGFLVHDGKVLLVKHRKLGFWLAPGGHVEEYELPHQAAEREFWEEAGVKVKAVSSQPLAATHESENLPQPFLSNLHWVSEQNYKDRLVDLTQTLSAKKPPHLHRDPKWAKGCEQHLCWMYLVEATGDLKFKQNTEESDGIGWFSEQDLATLETTEDIKNEIRMAIKMEALSSKN